MPGRPCPRSRRLERESGPDGKVQPGRAVWRLAHGWRLTAGSGIRETLISEFIRPAVRSVPPAIVRQLGRCQILIVEKLGRGRLASQWSETEQGLEISIAAGPHECPHDEHDVTLELLLCFGQALWTKLNHGQRKAYWLLLDREIGAGVTGEIDEDALQQKGLLFLGRYSAASRRRLDLYGAASFAGTAAEYIHCLWHDVTVRSGRDFLPAQALKRRLKLLSVWFPPARGHRLFPKVFRRQPPG
jgi:hypothetical protein